MVGGQTPRQQGNVGTEWEFTAFNLSALQIRLKTLNSSSLGQTMGQIQINAVLQMQQPEGCRTNTASDSNLESTTPGASLVSETPSGQRCWSIQQTQRWRCPSTASHHRKRHVNTQQGDGATPRTGRSLDRTSLREAVFTAEETHLSPNPTLPKFWIWKHWGQPVHFQSWVGEEGRF